MHILTPSSRVLLEMVIVTQLMKKFSSFCSTQRFIATFRRLYHWTLSWSSWIWSTPLQHI